MIFEADESQVAFKETPYNDESWEIIGVEPGPEVFEPMNVEIIKGAQAVIDPMFADYGGVYKGNEPSRFHLPVSENYKPVYAEKFHEEQEHEAREIAYQKHLEEAKAEAYEQGKLDALEESVINQNGKLEKIEEQIKLIFVDLTSQIDEKVNNIEAQALELAVQISRKVLGTTVEINPEYILPVIKEALNLGSSSVVSSVRVSPQDFEFIELVGLRKDLMQEGQIWDFKADESIKSGCILDTSTGEIDFDLDKMWERVAEQIVGIK